MMTDAILTKTVKLVRQRKQTNMAPKTDYKNNKKKVMLKYQGNIYIKKRNNSILEIFLPYSKC